MVSSRASDSHPRMHSRPIDDGDFDGCKLKIEPIMEDANWRSKKKKMTTTGDHLNHELFAFNNSFTSRRHDTYSFIDRQKWSMPVQGLLILVYRPISNGLTLDQEGPRLPRGVSDAARRHRDGRGQQHSGELSTKGRFSTFDTTIRKRTTCIRQSWPLGH